MTDYEVSLLWAVGLLIASLIVGFTAVTNRRPIGAALVMFVLGGFTLYYASSLSNSGDIARDIPGAVYKLYAILMK